jgi:hypothetical protein
VPVLVQVVGGLDRPTSFELVGGKVYVITLRGRCCSCACTEVIALDESDPAQGGLLLVVA